MSHWYREGKRISKIAIDDRAFQYGDGLFETIAIRGGEPRLWDYHLDRLAAGCERLRIEMPAAAGLRDWLDSALLQSREFSAYCVAKIIVSSGIGQRGYGRKAAEEPVTLIGVFPARPIAVKAYRKGVNTILCDTRLAPGSVTAGLKTLNRLEQVLARSECVAAGAFEGIVLCVDERVICGTMSNVFIVAGQSIVTPSLDRCGVAGTMRRHVLETLTRAGLIAEIRDVSVADLWASDEVFLTNSQFGVLPVTTCGDQVWAVGPLTRKTMALLAESNVTEYSE